MRTTNCGFSVVSLPTVFCSSHLETGYFVEYDSLETSFVKNEVVCLH